jgi:hypothetical protein
LTFEELKQAAETLGLGERATMAEIKLRHRQLVKLHHPDRAGTDNPELIRDINAAYRLLLDYLAGYRFALSEDEFYEQNPEERLRRQFMGDPIWGDR